MSDIEEILRSELHDVAGGVDVPPLPVLPDERPQQHWVPLLAAAAVLAIVLGVVAVVAVNRDDSAPQPTPSPNPTETQTDSKATEKPAKVSTAAPSIPYTLGEQLYVDGEQVPGRWWYLETSGPTWLAMSAVDNTWWWGRGPEPNRIEARIESAPVLSPDGLYVAMIDAENGVLTGFDTSFSGEGLMGVPVDLREPGLHVRAVTDDGRVIVQGLGTATLWLPFDDNATVDLTQTASGQEFLGGSPAGLVVSEGSDGQQYLAEISDAGELTRIQDLPAHDTVEVGPGAEWMVWTPRGTFGGETDVVRTLEVGTVDGGTRSAFEAPDGWSFEFDTWAWEDDDDLVSAVVKGQAEQLVRCSVLTETCVLIDAP